MKKGQGLRFVVFVVVVGYSSLALGQDMPIAIWDFGAEISPDGRYLAFFAAPRPPDQPPPTTEKSRLFVVDFDANSVTCCRAFTPNTFALSWQTKGEAQLFALEQSVDTTGVPNMSLIRSPPSGSPITVVQKFGGGPEPIWPFQIAALAWSPNGETLAAGGSFLDLSLSFDGGKSFVRTHTESGAARLRWANNETLLTFAPTWGTDGRIGEVKIRQRGVTSTREVAVGPELLLGGVLNGQAVYRRGHDVYVGDALFFHSENRIGPVFTDGGYVAIMLRSAEGDAKVVVCDSQRNAVGTRAIPRMATLMAVSAKRSSVYLAVWKAGQIHGCSFRDENKSPTIWRIPPIDDG
jgi:hypothetical protein